MKKSIIIIAFTFLLLLLGVLWIDRNHWHQVDIFYYAVIPVCNEFVGPELKCALLGKDGGIEGETYFLTDGKRRFMFIAGTFQTYPIVTVKRNVTKNDFKILQCKEEGDGPCLQLK